MIITLDVETFSECDLKKAGAWRYAEDPSTELLVATYSIDEAPVKTWWPGQPMPWDLCEAIENGAVIDAHNAMFERAIWTRILTPRHGWPLPEPHQWDCTMARAATRALPLALDPLGAALNLDTRKDKEGKGLITKLCKPRKPTKKDPSTRNQDPALIQRMGEYCAQDTRTEVAVRRRLGPMPPAERKLWILDQKINARGIAVDVAGVRSALVVVGQIEERLGKEFEKLTGLGFNQVTAVLEWLAARGLVLEDLTKDTVAETLEECTLERDHPVRRVLELRQILAKASTKKLKALLASVCSDGRVRGTQQYHGAFTGRWAGRLVQPQNLPRPHWDAPEGRENEWVAGLVSAIRTEDVDFVEEVYGIKGTSMYRGAMQAVVDALRSMFIAGPGKKLVSGDLSAIEAVGLAGLAGQESKLDVFRKRLDPYCTTASLIFGYEVTSKKTHPKERQVGKVGELAFGYGGGVNAWRNFDRTDTYSDEEINGFKRGWREGHPAIEQFWHALEAAAIAAVNGTPTEVNGILYRLQGEYLVCRLPSSRTICYYQPRLKETVTPWGKRVIVLTYMAQKEGRWKRVQTWGGKLAENVTQAACRDVLVPGMFAAEEEGLEIVLTVHDEIVVEVDEDRSGVVEVLTGAMAQNPGWAFNWPIRSEGWEGRRYRK